MSDRKIMEKKDKVTFEEKLVRLESIVQEMEDAKKPLEEIISLFKEGVKLSKECKKDLSRLETEVQKVLAENEDGTLTKEDI